MAIGHLFISTGRFRSFDEMRKFIDPQYDEDGDMIPSAFMEEIGLEEYEPGCIEAHHEERTARLADILRGASYAAQWIHTIDAGLQADAVICIYEPNVAERPACSSLTYVGSFSYEP